MKQEPILHICEMNAWSLAQERGVYMPSSLQEEGFIHCSVSTQILDVANRYYSNRNDLLVLVIQPQKVNAEIMWEQADTDIFPHIYGPLNLDAVSAVISLSVDAEGVFRHLPLAKDPG